MTDLRQVITALEDQFIARPFADPYNAVLIAVGKLRRAGRKSVEALHRTTPTKPLTDRILGEIIS